MATRSHRYWKLSLAVLALFVCIQPASATTFLYTFLVSETTIQNAITTSLGVNANLYGVYDVYIRPIQSADINGTTITGTALTNYTLAADGSPIPVGNDKWDADLNQHANSGLDTFLSIHFYFDQTDSKIALITNNANVVNKSYTNPTTNVGTVTGEQMPSQDTFRLTISSTDPNITGPVNFLMYTTALQFTDSSASSVAAKGVVKGPIEFSASGVNTPEPSTVAGALGGLAMMAAAWARRRKRSR